MCGFVCGRLSPSVNTTSSLFFALGEKNPCVATAPRASSLVTRERSCSTGGGRSIPIDWASVALNTFSFELGKRYGSVRSVTDASPTGIDGSAFRRRSASTFARSSRVAPSDACVRASTSTCRGRRAPPRRSARGRAPGTGVPAGTRRGRAGRRSARWPRPAARTRASTDRRGRSPPSSGSRASGRSRTRRGGRSRRARRARRPETGRRGARRSPRVARSRFRRRRRPRPWSPCRRGPGWRPHRSPTGRSPFRERA